MRIHVALGEHDTRARGALWRRRRWKNHATCGLGDNEEPPLTPSHVEVRTDQEEGPQPTHRE